jgi:N-methylhydantoinase A
MVQIVNTRMADKIRVLASQRAISLHDFTLVAGGGAGAVHAAAVAAEMGVRRVLSPPRPGAFSAIGLLCTDVAHDYVQSDVRMLRDLPIEHIQSSYDAMELRALSELREEGFGEDAEINYVREADVRYSGQGFEIRVPVSGGQLREAEKQDIGDRFNELHERLRGHAAQEEPVEIVSYRVRTEVAVPQFIPVPAGEAPSIKPAQEAKVSERQVSFKRGESLVPTGIWRRELLRYGNRLVGPAIVEQLDATTVIPPRWSGTIDAYGNLLLEQDGGNV